MTQPLFPTLTALKVMAPLTLPSSEGHWRGSISQQTQLGKATVGLLLQRLRACGWVRDAEQVPGQRRRYVELTDEGRHFFEFLREGIFPTQFNTVSPEYLFPFHARRHRDLGPPPDAAWVARAEAWQEAEQQAWQEVYRGNAANLAVWQQAARESKRLKREAQMAQIAQAQAEEQAAAEAQAHNGLSGHERR
ncbi:hypothetical protein [Deinococcus saxicola]|uniref:hypothetical protein n=1 Tax=Deinococcus saxicola TaxID=249406 RepID=UPI0039EEAAEB